MSTSAETGVGEPDGTTGVVQPNDGSLPSAHTEPAGGVQPHDGSLPSAHVEGA